MNVNVPLRSGIVEFVLAKLQKRINESIPTQTDLFRSRQVFSNFLASGEPAHKSDDANYRDPLPGTEDVSCLHL